MAKVLVALTMSLDGYIAGPNDGNELPLGEGGEALFEWFFTGDTPSRHDDRFKLSKRSAEVFDAGIDSCGAVVSGRRTYDIAGAWGGDGPVPGLPLFVLTHSVPAEVPEPSVPYTFVTDGIDSAITQAKGRPRATSTWRSRAPRPPSSAFGWGCWTRSSSAWCPCCWVAGFACSTTSADRSDWRSSAWSMPRV
jgi:dihydrofolate reductase